MTTPHEHRLVIVDTETTGLPQYLGFATYFPPNMAVMYDGARLIELAAATYSAEGEEIERDQTLVHPEGPFHIDPTSLRIHGIQHETVVKTGRRTSETLDKFYRLLQRAGAPYDCVLVGHNIAFDWHIIASEAYRAKCWDLIHLLYATPTFCTMHANTIRCGLLRSNGKRKWPKLGELHEYMFPGQAMLGAHTAMGDVLGTARCLFEAIRLDKERYEKQKRTLVRY